MGCRGQVLIKDEGVYLYTHWGADELLDRVKKALRRKQRWGDPEYLARIVFDAIKGDDTTSETGFGIGSVKHKDIEKLVVLDCAKKELKYQDLYDTKKSFVMSFEEVLS